MAVKWLLYAVLLTCSLAMCFLLIGFFSLQMGMVWFGSWVYLLAGRIILLAFLVLSIGSSGLMVQTVCRELSRYFHGDARAFRQVTTLQLLSLHTQQRQQLERRQVQYLYELKRQQLVVNDDKRSSLALHKAIQAELLPSIAPERHKTVQKYLKQYRKQANPQAMLVLREQELRRCLSAG